MPASGLAQISDGGVPTSFGDRRLHGPIATVTLPAVNIDSLLRADSVEQMNDGWATRFGQPIPVDLGLANAGTWNTLSDGGRVWRLQLVARGARSINIIYDHFRLPARAQLFLYDPQHHQILGAFSERNNKPHGHFSTDLIYGDSTVLEYLEPHEAAGRSELHLSHVIYGYRDVGRAAVGNPEKASGGDRLQSNFGFSAPCEVDVSCPEAASWCRERHAVAIHLLDFNSRFASGSLLNNVRRDFTPYFLAAFHSVDANKDGLLSTQEKDDAETWLFWFGYYAESCPADREPDHVSFSGATFHAGNAATDFVLLELAERPAGSNAVYYLGWSRDDHAPSEVTILHHPWGDVMKYTHDNEPPVSNDPNFWHVGSETDEGYDVGTTEGGSSGAPWIDGDHHVIAQHFGGATECLKRVGDGGKFCLSWAGGGTPDTRLQDWLDPDHVSPMTLDGVAATVKLHDRHINDAEIFAAYTAMEAEGELPPSNSEFLVSSGADVTMKAGEEIRLKNGVRIESGAIFHAYIEIPTCDDVIDWGDARAHRDEPETQRRRIEPGMPALSPIDILREFPNPTHGRISITYAVIIPGEITLAIYDALGRVVAQPVSSELQGVGHYSVLVDLGDKPAGSYYYRLTTPTGTQVVKLALTK